MRNTEEWIEKAFDAVVHPTYYPHVFITRSSRLYTEARAWLIETYGESSKWSATEYLGWRYMRFHDEDLAFAFKMRWY